MAEGPALQQARRVFQAVSGGLRARYAGARTPGLPDWIDPQAIESVALDLPGARAVPELRIALRDGVGGRTLPCRWSPDGLAAAVPLRPVRAPRAVAQGAPGVVRSGTPQLDGTATCLVRDRLAPQRHYLVTCGHVMAPTSAARAEDRATIDDGGRRFDGYLVEWQPAHGEGALPTRLDAALVEVTPADAVALQRNAAMLPSGCSSTYGRGMAVTLRRRGAPVTGSLEIYWSGPIDLPLPDVDEYPSYFLDDAIGYRLDSPSEPGDSGAAVWDRGDALLGMHIGAIDGAAAGRPNAIFGRIAPVFEWFNVQPYLAGDPATLDVHPGAARASRPSADHLALDEGDRALKLVAQTIYGEASSEQEPGMRAVGSVILNRVKTGYRGSTPAEVCLWTAQFSCWGPGPNRDRMERAARLPDDAYRQCLRIARMVFDRSLTDNTSGARHYHVVGTRAKWAEGHRPCTVIGRHAFYNDVR